MYSLVKSGKNGDISTPETATNGFYFIMFTSESYTLQDNTNIYGQIITDGELVVKAQYLCSMQEIANWFWYQHPQQKFITVPTRTILNPQMDVTAITDIYDITKSACNTTQAKNPYQDILFL